MGGTRPEALKLAPLVPALRADGVLRPYLVASGQHPTMFHQGLAAFGLRPDLDLHLDRVTGSQAELAARLGEELDEALGIDPPAAVVVQGDTTTALVGALSAFWRRIPVVHLEAGLRSHDLASPFPEEGNRRLIGQIAALHLAPTEAAADNLVAAGLGGPEVAGHRQHRRRRGALGRRPARTSRRCPPWPTAAPGRRRRAPARARHRAPP